MELFWGDAHIYFVYTKLRYIYIYIIFVYKKLRYSDSDLQFLFVLMHSFVTSLPFHSNLFFQFRLLCCFCFTVYRLFHVHLRFLLSREKGGISGEIKHFENLFLCSVGLFDDVEVLVLCHKVPHASVGETVLARQYLSWAVTKRVRML